MAKAIQSREWYRALIEDLKSVITEGVFNSNWTLLQTYHLVGKRILEEQKAQKISGSKLRHSVSRDLGKSVRTIQRACQFAEKFPDINELPEGKAITWSKITRKYLPEPKEQCSHDIHEETIKIFKCSLCGKQWAKDPRQAKSVRVDNYIKQDNLIKLLKSKMGMDGTWAENRDYVSRCIKKWGYDKVEKIIQLASNDEFWHKNATSFKVLYRNGVKILNLKSDVPVQYKKFGKEYD